MSWRICTHECCYVWVFSVFTWVVLDVFQMDTNFIDVCQSFLMDVLNWAHQSHQIDSKSIRPFNWLHFHHIKKTAWWKNVCNRIPLSNHHDVLLKVTFHNEPTRLIHLIVFFRTMKRYNSIVKMFQYKDMRFTLFQIMRILRFGNFGELLFSAIYWNKDTWDCACGFSVHELQNRRCNVAKEH